MEQHYIHVPHPPSLGTSSYVASTVMDEDTIVQYNTESPPPLASKPVEASPHVTVNTTEVQQNQFVSIQNTVYQFLQINKHRSSVHKTAAPSAPTTSETGKCCCVEPVVNNYYSTVVFNPLTIFLEFIIIILVICLFFKRK